MVYYCETLYVTGFVKEVSILPTLTSDWVKAKFGQYQHSLMAGESFSFICLLITKLWSSKFMKLDVRKTLFANTVTYVNYVIIYIYKAKKPSVRLSVCLTVCPSVTSITHLGLPVSTHQGPNPKRSSSAYSKFVTASSRVLPFAL